MLQCSKRIFIGPMNTQTMPLSVPAVPLVPLVVCHLILIHCYKAVRGYTFYLWVCVRHDLFNHPRLYDLFQSVDHGCAMSPRQHTAHTTKRIAEQFHEHSLRTWKYEIIVFFYSVWCTNIFFLFPVQLTASCPKIKSHPHHYHRICTIDHLCLSLHFLKSE